MLDVVCDFVESHGRWPRSWDELELVSRQSQGGWIWPEDRSKLESYVAIDFSYDIRDFSPVTMSTFNGIRPLKMSYELTPGIYERLNRLLKDKQQFSVKPKGA